MCDNGSREFTDGTWLWPEGFSHYVENHQVRPPAEFVAWALAHYEEARSRPRHVMQRPECGRPRAIATQAAIDELLAQARLVRVIEGTQRRKHEEFLAAVAQARFDSGETDDKTPSDSPRTDARSDRSTCTGRSGGRPEIEELARVLKICESPNRRPLVADEDGGEHAWGSTVRIVLEGCSSTTIHVASVHDGGLIDCVEWAWGTYVLDGLGLLRWVDRMGIPQPLRKLEEAAASRAQEAVAEAVWRAAAPSCIQAMLPARGIPTLYSWEMWAALRAAYTTDADALVALFRWLGSTVLARLSWDAEIIELLERGSLSRTLEAIEHRVLDDVALEGVARFVTYWAIGRSPGAATAVLSPAMRGRLLDHATCGPLAKNRDALVTALS